MLDFFLPLKFTLSKTLEWMTIKAAHKLLSKLAAHKLLMKLNTASYNKEFNRQLIG